MDEQSDKRASTEELVPLVYQELREAARRYFLSQRPGFTLRPTELVNEACLHLLVHSPGPWNSAEHFRAIATRKIWQVVVDHLRRRRAAKRGGSRGPSEPLNTPDAAADDQSGAAHPESAWQRIPLESIRVEWRERQIELLDLADALEELSRQHARLGEVVMLHWFGGLKYADVAGLLGISASTVEKDFRYALAWLNRRLDGARHDGD
jgi:RNA polymerase sigma factor (sigma-70 family)